MAYSGYCQGSLHEGLDTLWTSLWLAEKTVGRIYLQLSKYKLFSFFWRCTNRVQHVKPGQLHASTVSWSTLLHWCLGISNYKVETHTQRLRSGTGRAWEWKVCWLTWASNPIQLQPTNTQLDNSAKRWHLFLLVGHANLASHNNKIGQKQGWNRIWFVIGNSCDQFIINNYGRYVSNLTPLFPSLPPQNCFDQWAASHI